MRRSTLEVTRKSTQVNASLQNQNLRTDLRRVAKRWKTCIDLRTNLSSTKVNASQRKWVAKRNASWTQVETLRWFASTCQSVWSGLKFNRLYLDSVELLARNCHERRLWSFPDYERRSPNAKISNVFNAGFHEPFLRLTLFEFVRHWIKGAVSPIVHSAPKCSSSIGNTYALSNPFPSKPSIIFSPQKPFYSQPNYSSWS